MNKNNTRPGLKTTEFWLALLVTVMGAIAATYAETDIGRTAGMVSAALATAGYGFVRSNVKRVEVAGKVAAAERADMIRMQLQQQKGSR